jgi:hypothetical protein
MELLLARKWFSPHATVGELFVAGRYQCYTLEDLVRVDDPTTVADEGVKVYGKTAIPEGRYRLSINYSRRFNMVLPILHDVPGFTGIRIHAGNDADDTEGCILVGRTRKPDWVGDSRQALGDLMWNLSLPAFITIQNVRTAA